MIGKVCCAAAIASVLFCSSGFAQTATTPAASTPAASATTSAPAAPAVTTKQAKSKECSMEADKEGLHGKARKAFRSKCKSGKA